jgi:hypothetical protein
LTSRPPVPKYPPAIAALSRITGPSKLLLID